MGTGEGPIVMGKGPSEHDEGMGACMGDVGNL